MATVDFPVRRLVIAGGFAAAIAITPTIAVFAAPGLAKATPTAPCPSGEHNDVFTNICVPMLVPSGGVADPRPSQEQTEQDVYGTPGLNPYHAGGTTVP